MDKIGTLDEISKEIYSNNFRVLTTDQKLIIVNIQHNRILEVISSKLNKISNYL